MLHNRLPVFNPGIFSFKINVVSTLCFHNHCWHQPGLNSSPHFCFCSLVNIQCPRINSRQVNNLTCATKIIHCLENSISTGIKLLSLIEMNSSHWVNLGIGIVKYPDLRHGHELPKSKV